MDTFKPEDPSRTVGISTLACRRLCQIERCSPYGMFFVVPAILELRVYVVVGKRAVALVGVLEALLIKGVRIMTN